MRAESGIESTVHVANVGVGPQRGQYGRLASAASLLATLYIAMHSAIAAEWVTTAADATYGVGYYTSMTVLPSGHPAIAYHDYQQRDLEYAWYDGSVWSHTTIDSAGTVGAYPSLAVLPSGAPAVSYYYSGGFYELRYAVLDGGVWDIETVDLFGGSYTSLAVLPSGEPAISYFGDGNLKYAWHDGVGWNITTVDSSGTVGKYSSLAILPSGQPAISYYDQTFGALKYAWFDGASWQIEIIHGGPAGRYTSLVILPTGEPAISFIDEGQSAVSYAWLDADVWQIDIVEQGTWSAGTSLAILPSGSPAVSYCMNGALHYATLDGDTWRPQTVCAGNVGWYSSLALRPSGSPAISFHDMGNGNLAYAAAEPRTLYVDDDAAPGGDGLSWATALAHLQDALTIATPLDEIRVAGGTYVPSAQTDPNEPRSATFQVLSGVTMRGGYAGLADPNQPDTHAPALYETNLSGDRLGNDGPDFADNDDNCWTVVTCSGTDSTCVVESIVVSAGHHETVAPTWGGAGVSGDLSEAVFRACVFRANATDEQGGAAYLYFSNATFENCTFQVHPGFPGNAARILRKKYSSSRKP